MSSVAVVDLGTGNLRSVAKAIGHVAPSTVVSISDDPSQIRRADRVVFPGQGAMGSCIAALDSKGLREVMLEVIQNKPVLGICLGQQALFAHSEEDGGVDGFGVFSGSVRRLDPRPPGTASRLKIPHMGWNTVHQQTAHPLWQGIAQDARFYFVHSYAAFSDTPEEVAGVTEYGVAFVSATARDNLFAVQFHPEKSQQSGLRLLENFVQWDGTNP